MLEVWVFMEFALARGAAVRRGLERVDAKFSLGRVISVRKRVANLRRILDTLIMQADRHSDPHECDRGWFPYLSNCRRGQYGSGRQFLHLGRPLNGI